MEQSPFVPGVWRDRVREIVQATGAAAVTDEMGLVVSLTRSDDVEAGALELPALPTGVGRGVLHDGQCRGIPLKAGNSRSVQVRTTASPPASLDSSFPRRLTRSRTTSRVYLHGVSFHRRAGRGT